MNKPYENKMPSGVDSFVEEATKEEVKTPEKPMQQKFTSKDYGNVRVYPNETGSNMDKNNKWIGKRYSLMEAHNLNDDYLKKNLVGKTKSGADIYKMPDGYFSGNPRINDASFKNVQDLEDFEKKSGEHRAAMKEGTYLDDYIKNYNQPKPDWKQTKMASGVLHEQGKNRIVEESTPDFKSKQYRVGGTQGKVYNSLDEAKNSFNQEQPKPTYTPFKLDRAKYSDVETTPYGFIYNVGGQSITDMAGQAHAFGEHDPKKKYGWTRTTDSGDEIVHESFEDAYKAINKEKLDKEYENDMARRDKRIKSYSNEDGIDDMKTAASYLVNAPHEFEELSSELVNRIENVKDKGKLEDIIFENLQIGDSYEEAVENALENFKNEDYSWAKEKKPISKFGDNVKKYMTNTTSETSQWDLWDKGKEYVEEYGNPTMEELGEPLKISQKEMSAILNNPSYSRDVIKNLKQPTILYSPYRSEVLYVDPQGSDFVKSGIVFEKSDIRGWSGVKEEKAPDGSSYINSVDDFQAEDIAEGVSTKQAWQRMLNGETFWDVVGASSLDSEPRNAVASLIEEENGITEDQLWALDAQNEEKNKVFKYRDEMSDREDLEAENTKIANYKNTSKWAATHPNEFNELVAWYKKSNQKLPSPEELDELARSFGAKF